MRRSVARVLTVVTALVLARAAPAFEPITNGEVVKMTSKILGEERTILISTPRGYDEGKGRFPVLYMTDGDSHFLHTRGTVDFLVRNGLMPDVVIVGVMNTDRTRDLTPTKGYGQRDDGTRVPLDSSGGAPRFLEFFEKELIPYVEGAYRTAPYRVFAGHSLGGLFALTSFVEKPGLFNASIAASPALAWDDDVILDRTAKYLESRKELRYTLFVTMANEEDGDPSPTRFERLRRILKRVRADGFAWGAELLSDEDHGSVVLRSHYDGLRKVFDGWRLPRDRGAGGYPGTVDDLKKHYGQLSVRFGYVIPAPELTVNQVGYQHLVRKDVKGALPFFRWNVELYPESANVHDSLGEALETAGKNAEAHASYEKAVEIAKRTSDARLETFTRNRDRMAAAAGK
jgi:predicted alpha/beta superfamily hydrolase